MMEHQNFELLTKQFLHMEHNFPSNREVNCNRLAYKLAIHKTQQVLMRAEDRLQFYCNLINEEKTILSEKNFIPWQVTHYR